MPSYIVLVLQLIMKYNLSKVNELQHIKTKKTKMVLNRLLHSVSKFLSMALHSD